jgi:hypothetical protein
MLDYIKQQLAARSPQPDVTFTEADIEQQTDELVTEYAHIFQELDDLTVEGEDAHRDRPIALDIPIEDDVELDTVELNLMDNRLVDVPMDVTTNMESFVEQMKTFEDFYREACEAIVPFDREDDDMLDIRRSEYAQEQYNIYHKQMEDEGLFGFEPVSIADKIVPTSIMESFGILDESNPNQKYMVKMPVMFELTGDQTIYRSQLDALKVANVNCIYEQFTDVLQKKLGINNVWDVVTPKRVIVPRTLDDYELIVEFDYDKSDKPIYEGWAYRRKPSERDVEVHSYPHESIKDIVENITMMNKKDYVHQESYIESITPDRWNLGSMFQESVDRDVRKSNRQIIKSLKSCEKALKKLSSDAKHGKLESNPNFEKMKDFDTLKILRDQFGEIANNKNLPRNKYKIEFDKLYEDFKIAYCGIENAHESIDRYSKNVDKNWNRDYRDYNNYNTWEDVRKGMAESIVNSSNIHIHYSTKRIVTIAYNLYKAGVKYMKSISKDVDLSDAKFMEAYELDLDIYQEAIDFGYPDETTEAAKQNQPASGGDTTNADPSTPTVSSDGNTENTDQAEPADVSVDSNADNMDQQAPPPDDASAENPPADDPNKLPVDTNDVSDQIADNVSDQTSDQQNADTGVDANGDISIDDTNSVDNVDSTNDMSSNVNFDNIDTSLDDLDNTGDQTPGGETMGDPANMDINSMSIDDIMAQAAEKLKSMPIEQVKQFLSDGAAMQEAYAQEGSFNPERRFNFSDIKSEQSNSKNNQANGLPHRVRLSDIDPDGPLPEKIKLDDLDDDKKTKKPLPDKIPHKIPLDDGKKTNDKLPEKLRLSDIDDDEPLPKKLRLSDIDDDEPLPTKLKLESFAPDPQRGSARQSSRKVLTDELTYLLGILNSNKSLPEIVDTFKKYGKEYNNDVIKLTRNTKEFTSSEIQLLNVLSHRLNNLMIGFKPTSDKQETEHIKSLIKDFTACSDKVLKTLSK